MINNEKNVKLEKEDLKIWLNSTAPPSVSNCTYLPLTFLSNCRETESLNLLCNILLLYRILDQLRTIRQSRKQGFSFLRRHPFKS